MPKKKHRYRVICKVQLNSGDWIFRKFNTSDLQYLQRWLMRRYANLAYVNVFALNTPNYIKGQQLGSFTKYTKIERAQLW